MITINDTNEDLVWKDLGEISKFITYTSKYYPKEIEVKGVTLAGSHSKNTWNTDSDVDLNIYFNYTFPAVLKLNADTINITPSDNIRMESKSGTTSFIMDNREFEVHYIPIRSIHESNRELMVNLYHQKIDYYFKLLHSIPIISTPYFDEFLNYMITDFNVSKDSIYGYFHGYMMAQLQRHKRRCDGTRRLTQSMDNNTAKPMAKFTIDGVYIALSGIQLLENQTISRDFKKLFDSYRDILTDEERTFVDECYEYKRNRTPIHCELGIWLEHSMGYRDSIFQKLDARIKVALTHSTLPEFTPALRKSNEFRLNEFINALYQRK